MPHEVRRDRSGDDDDRWSGWSGELDPEPPEGAGTSGDGETQAVVAWPAGAPGDPPVHGAEPAAPAPAARPGRRPAPGGSQPRSRSRALERAQATASADARPARTRSRWLQPDLLLGAVLIFIVLALGALLFFQVVWVVITG
jgi:hypothetical protein